MAAKLFGASAGRSRGRPLNTMSARRPEVGMRFLGRTAVVLAPVVAFVLSACGDRGGQNARSATVYSCDNTIVTPDGAAGCFPPDDPKYMTIALRSQPATGSATRFADAGNGVSVTVLKQQEIFGTTWYEVNADGKVGWVAEHLVVFEQLSD